MIQNSILIIVLIAALAYFGRFIYRQVTAGGGEGDCDKCAPKRQIKNMK